MASKSMLVNDNTIVELYKQGVALVALSNIFKCHTRRIGSILNKYGIERRKGGISRPRSKETVAKTVAKQKGQKRTEEFCKNNGITHKGMKLSDEVKRHLSISRIGKYCKEENPNWSGGVTTENELVRKSEKYKEWRKKVMERDNYTCQFCSQIGGKLHVDHIKPFSIYKHLRLEINNGRTLCTTCHKDTPTYGSKLKQLNYKEE